MSVRRIPALLVAGAALALLSAASPTPVEAQFGKRLKDAVKRTAEDKTIQTVTDKERQAMDDAIRGSGSGEGKTAPAGGAQPAAATASGTESSAAAPSASPAREQRPGEGAWANYDFVPGTRPLFVHDFSRDNVGDFPRRLEFKEGNMEVVEWNGARWLRALETSEFAIPLAETLPDRFTMEFDYAGWNKYELKIDFTDASEDHTQVLLGAWGSGVYGAGVRANTKVPEDIEKRIARVRIMADGKYVKVYVDSQRVANVPNAHLGRASKIWVQVPVYGETPALLGNFSVMAGGKDMYDALAEEGRVATQGIYFDTGSDRLRPESTPTLKQIGTMLQQHADLRVAIEGHTDNVGKPDANKALSERRAAAVRQYLIDTFGIDASRLEARGLGDTKPVGDNKTPEGRQANRRVELVKL